jgi:hypothetical protein
MYCNSWPCFQFVTSDSLFCPHQTFGIISYVYKDDKSRKLYKIRNPEICKWDFDVENNKIFGFHKNKLNVTIYNANLFVAENKISFSDQITMMKISDDNFLGYHFKLKKLMFGKIGVNESQTEFEGGIHSAYFSTPNKIVVIDFKNDVHLVDVGNKSVLTIGNIGAKEHDWQFHDCVDNLIIASNRTVYKIIDDKLMKITELK